MLRMSIFPERELNEDAQKFLQNKERMNKILQEQFQKSKINSANFYVEVIDIFVSDSIAILMCIVPGFDETRRACFPIIYRLEDCCGFVCSGFIVNKEVITFDQFHIGKFHSAHKKLPFCINGRTQLFKNPFCVTDYAYA